jgi:hypothetical protein
LRHSIRRERTASFSGLASAFNTVVTRGAKPFNSHQHSIAQAVTLNVNRFKFSPAAQSLTPELTGREVLYQAFNLANESQADSAPVE